MHFSGFSIRKPIFTFVCALLLLLLGAVGLYKLEMREYPFFERPIIQVRVDYPSSSPEIIYQKLTRPLEKKLMDLSDLEALEAWSDYNHSNLTLRFKAGASTKQKLIDIKARVFSTSLPQEASSPKISEYAQASHAFAYVGVFSSDEETFSSYEYSKKHLLPFFKRLTGVSQAGLYGQVKTTTIAFYPEVFESYQLTLTQVMEAIKRHKDFEGGVNYFGDQKIPLVLKGALGSIKELEELIILQKDKHNIRLKDIAKLSQEADPYQPIFRLNAQPITLLSIHKQQTANPLMVSKEIQQALNNLKDKLPSGVSIQLIADDSLFIKSSLNELFQSLLEAGVLVIMIILFFLKSLRAVFIPLITIPLSLIGSLFFLYLMGYSLNTMTLLALVLSIGMVVDDAIVVLENIYRHIEKGRSPREAAFEGSKEITFSVVAMTLTLICVFFPLFFFKGLVGSLFSEFGFTLSLCVALSGYVALSSCACLSAYLLRPLDLKHVETEGRSYQHFYARSLKAFNTLPYLGLFLWVLSLLLCGYLYLQLPKQLSPSEDRGSFTLSVHEKGAIDMQKTQKHILYLESLTKDLPEVDKTLSFHFGSTAIHNVLLKPWGKRKKSQSELSRELFTTLKNYPLAPTHLQSPMGLIDEGNPHSLTMVMKSAYDSSSLYHLEAYLQEVLNSHPLYPKYFTHLPPYSYENQLIIQHDKLESYQVHPHELSLYLQMLHGGYTWHDYQSELADEGLLFKWGQVTQRNLKDLNHLFYPIQIKGKQSLLPLSELLSYRQALSPPMLSHYNGYPSFGLTIQLDKGQDFQKAVEYFQSFSKEKLPSFYDLEFTGLAKSYLEGNEDLLLTLVFACLAIYLVLTVQFESFLDPLVILLTVPLAMLGTLLALWLAGSSWNFYSQIGMITLVGIITKHGILIIDAAKQLQQTGMTPKLAILEASVKRLRPILMTALSTLFGTLPFLFSKNAGAELRFDIGLSVIGGLVLGSLLTLYIIPSIYLLFSQKKI